MTENFAQRFVDHCNVGLAPQAVAKFPLHHRKRGFNVGTLMVMLQKLGAPELKIVVHLLPCSASVPAMVRGERNERRGPESSNRFCIAFAGIPLVSGDFGNLKVLSRTLRQRGKHNGIVRMATVNLYGGHDVGFDSNHEMAFDPIVLFPNLSVLVVKPASETASGKARGIHGKVCLYRLERQTGLRDEVLQDRSQFRLFKVIGNAVKVRNLGNVSALLSGQT
jgi:hypothetical protein